MLACKVFLLMRLYACVCVCVEERTAHVCEFPPAFALLRDYAAKSAPFVRITYLSLGAACSTQTHMDFRG